METHIVGRSGMGVEFLIEIQASVTFGLWAPVAPESGLLEFGRKMYKCHLWSVRKSQCKATAVGPFECWVPLCYTTKTAAPLGHAILPDTQTHAQVHQSVPTDTFKSGRRWLDVVCVKEKG